MSRKYQHIIYYETEIINMINRGHTLREIGNKLGFIYNEMQDFKTRYNKKQRMVETGKVLKKRRRLCKNGSIPPSIEKLDKLAQMRYVLASKEKYIKRLEMKVELMRDFLSHTERYFRDYLICFYILCSIGNHRICHKAYRWRLLIHILFLSKQTIL